MYQSDSEKSLPQKEEANDKVPLQDLNINEPSEFLSFCLKDKKIKVMDECNPILPHVYLKDISLHKKGPLEDKIYSKNDNYYQNIRRGNTLCQIYDQNQQEKQLVMCRRGMKKFYDLQPEYLKVNRQLTHQQERYRKRIFQLLDKRISDQKIHLYCLFKENGEHLQISFMKELGYWLFASKNVAIIAKSKEDLQNHYGKERFYWAKLIGNEFFKILQKMSEEEQENLQKDLEGKTLLGEYCGYEKHQHITKYQEVQLIFYGLVENYGLDHCVPVRECEKILKKYKLKMSKMVIIENLKQKNEVYESMYKMLKDVAEGTMQLNGEGSVMYIVSEQKDGKQRTIGMCKLKTCQYLIYRKMREMIKIYFAKKGSTANTFQKYQFQIQNLCETYFLPPKPLQFYFQIAKEAFKEVKNHSSEFTDEEFRYRFVSFLDSISKRTHLQSKNKLGDGEVKILLICPPLLPSQYAQIQKYCKKNKIPTSFSYRSSETDKKKNKKLSIVHMVPRFTEKQYTHTIFYIKKGNQKQTLLKELQESKDLSKPHLISFIKSEDKQKSIDLLQDKIEKSAEAFQGDHEVIKNFPQFMKILRSSMEQSKVIAQGTEVRKTKTVIIPLLIPGSGKSTLAKALSLKNQNMKVISSDDIRQKIMMKLQKSSQQESTVQELFQKTKEEGMEAFNQQMEKMLSENKEKQEVIFIDRVFCPTTLVENMKLMQKKWVRFVIIAQKIIPTKLNNFIYPLSMKHLLICLKRSLQREDHKTLTTEPNMIAKVLLKFYQMYRGYNFGKLGKYLENIDWEILHFEMTNEDEGEGINQHLKKKVEECLQVITPGHEPPPSHHYTELIEMIYKYDHHIEESQDREKLDHIVSHISKCIYD